MGGGGVRGGGGAGTIRLIRYAAIEAGKQVQTELKVLSPEHVTPCNAPNTDQ